MSNFTLTPFSRAVFSLHSSGSPSVAGATLNWILDGETFSTPLITNPGLVAALQHHIDKLNPGHPGDPQLSGNDPAWLACQQAIYWMLCSGTVTFGSVDEGQEVQQDGVEIDLRTLSTCAWNMLVALVDSSGPTQR